MNQFLPDKYVETVHRLALGIEPIDAHRRRRLSYPLQVAYYPTPPDLLRPTIQRHSSNLFAVRYQREIAQQFNLQFFDSARHAYKPEYDRRRVVPRRLLIPILSLNDVESQEKINKKAFTRRIRRPAFFPGAAYDFSPTATGLRGRVVRNSQPMRWARVVATLVGETLIVGHAHGDDRGEFLLLINAQAATGSALPNPLRITVTVSGPTPVLTPDPPNLAVTDPLWDLPIETLADPGDDDPVATGVVLPANYTASVSRDIEFPLGKCLSEEPEFEIPSA